MSALSPRLPVTEIYRDSVTDILPIFSIDTPRNEANKTQVSRCRSRSQFHLRQLTPALGRNRSGRKVPPDQALDQIHYRLVVLAVFGE